MICKYKTLDAFPSDMTRQYKTMQTEMGLRIHKLETDLLRTRQLLGYNSRKNIYEPQSVKTSLNDKIVKIKFITLNL